MQFLLSNRATSILAAFLLVIMALTAFFSMKWDALTFDELAHIPAGYSYFTEQDYRINPEHPPLAKLIGAFPLLFLDLHFPTESHNWLQEGGPPAWWVQFDLGREFIYESGNNPRDIIIWSRIGMIAMLLFIGWFLFRWAREVGGPGPAGNAIGLGVLTLFAFSPTFLAHGRLVNTDVAAVLGVVVATYYWLKLLESPTRWTVLKAGAAFCVALLLKFSLILLIPFFALLTIAYPLLKPENRFKELVRYVGLAAVAGIIGIMLIWPVYQLHITNYPAERQLRDTIADFQAGGVTPLQEAAIWMTDKEILRPWAQYARGTLMAIQRSSLGNTTYFLGEMRDSSWTHYFPVMYAVKIPLAFHLMTLAALGWGAFLLFRNTRGPRLFWRAAAWTKDNFQLVALALFVAIYWAASIQTNLNLGVRHLMPVFPFMYILVLVGLQSLLQSSIMTISKRNAMFAGGAFVLLGWYVMSSLAAFPHYIPYYNALAGGTNHGYRIAVDSNYDWGQDFYRLLAFVEENEIETLYLDHFGGENPAYWLGERYVRYNPREAQGPPSGWFAVSVNEFMGGVGRPHSTYTQSTGYYDWLLDHEPVARAGKSIFIYFIE